MTINPYNLIMQGKDTQKIIEIMSEEDCDEKLNIDYVAMKAEKYIISKYLDILSKSESNKIQDKIQEYVYGNFKNIQEEDLKNVINKVLNKIFGYGILQKYITDSITTDIRAVRYNDIYIKQFGKWLESNESFNSEEEFEEYVRYCVFKNNSVINNEYPIVIVSDKEFNLRLEAGIKPVNTEGASLVVRIHKQDGERTLEALMIKHNMFDVNVYKLLIEAVKKEKNVIICGRGGSGKTTLLRAIIDKIPRERSIVSNEETAELYLKRRNIIQRETLLNRNEIKKIDLEMLTRHALVMSCETIILGELKSREANVFFDAISTGHNGYATVHADSTQNTIDRIIVLIKKDVRAQSYKEGFLRQLLASSIGYIIYMEHYKVVTISEVSYNKEKNDIECIDVFSKKGSGKNCKGIL